MSDDEAGGNSSFGSGLAAVGAVAVVVGCCAALPVLAALAGSVAVGTILGIGAGIAALVALVGLVVLRARRRAACEAADRQAEGLFPDS